METTYNIEITKTNKPKSGYRIKWSGLNVSRAEFYWDCLNVGNGYKARVRNNFTGKIVARKA